MVLRSIPHAFAQQCSRTPHAPALVGEGALSYAELARKADLIARWLASRGIGRGGTVGLYAQRSPEAIAAILGILQAGAAYIPLDPSYPFKLLRYIYEDSAPAAMLVQDSLLTARPDDVFWTGEALRLGTDLAIPSTADPGPDVLAVHGDDVAYVMYTSGSTGRPKGVVVPHRAVVRLVRDNDYADLGPDEVILQLAPLSFDASTFEIWGALLNGGRLAIVSDPHPSLQDIGGAIERHGVTTLWLTAGLFHLMVDNCLEALRPLRQLLAGGDVLSPAHVLKVIRALPGCRLVNGYGPTENTTFSCCYTVPGTFDGSTALPIGRPIRHTEALVLDESLQPVASGSEGELFVGGLGLAHGYLNRPELTAERFMPHPFDTTPGARLYRTGDRVRLRPDGILEFLGRVDRQVKINGKRVELDEIEARLRASSLVQDAAVVCSEGSAGQRLITAFVTPCGKEAVDVDLLRRNLREELPDYMIPSSFTVMDALPLSPTGKIDRARLPAITPPLTPKHAYAPVSGAEAALMEIWRSVLKRDVVGVDDNFFDLGGTSLQLMEVHTRVSRTLASDVTVVDMFRYPKICSLAEHIAHRGAIEQPAAARQPGLSAQDRASRQRAALGRRRPFPSDKRGAP